MGREYFIKNVISKLNNNKIVDFKLSDSDIKNESHEPIFDMIIDDGNITTVLSWEDLKTIDEEIPTYGLTCFDNGSREFVDETSFETEVLNIPNKMSLQPVKGFKHNINYDYEIIGDSINLKGGFFQGFYKLEGYEYESIPNRFDKGWTISMDLQPDSSEHPNTLNAMNPTNEGFFFYWGARAENKFWNTFEGNNPTEEGTKETTYKGVVEEEFIIPLNPPRIVIKEESNEFLIYGRSSGNSICNSDESKGFGTNVAGEWKQGESLKYSSLIPLNEINDGVNPFLKYGRSGGKSMCGGEKPNEYGEMIAGEEDEEEFDLSDTLDINEDVGGNCCGFRLVKDVLSGGYKFSYRRILKNEETNELYVKEEITKKNIISDGENRKITIKWTTNEVLSDVTRKGDLLVYVDSLLKVVFYDFEEIVNRPLNEHFGKQVGVPYNISIGGGTLGLKESITFDGPDESDSNKLIEQNFAGSFIGKISNFKIFKEPLNWCQIKNI